METDLCRKGSFCAEMDEVIEIAAKHLKVIED